MTNDNRAISPDGRALLLARKIAVDTWYPKRHPSHYIEGRERILNGDLDTALSIQAVLAAIIETTRLAAEWIEGEQPGRLEYSDDPIGAASAHYVDGLENYEHLPADGGK